jgi:pimeloyl-ACP methyl ester carboxylesterase
MMEGKIEQITTDDGYILHGLVTGSRDGCSTWVVHIHGSYGNFYENFFLSPMAAAYSQRGIAFASINTRGHDYYSDLKSQDGDGYTSRRIGGVREIFRDCLLDIEPWIALVRERGAKRVILQGHSLGAMKAAFHAWRRPEKLDGLILLSPPDNFGLQHGDVGDRFQEYLDHAKSRAATHPDELMPDAAFEDLISCASYAALFGDPTETGMFTYGDLELMRKSALGHITVPVLATFGTESEAVVDDLEVCIEALEATVGNQADLHVQVIEGANHNYHSREDRLAECLAEFVERRSPTNQRHASASA